MLKTCKVFKGIVENALRFQSLCGKLFSSFPCKRQYRHLSTALPKMDILCLTNYLHFGIVILLSQGG